MSYRRRYRRRTSYRRYQPTPPRQDNSCLIALVTLAVTWGLGIAVIIISIALHRH